MDSLTIAGKAYGSRLLIGTGKYKDFDETRRAVDASGAQIVTVAIRRTNIGQNAGEPSLKLAPDYQLGCKRALPSNDFYPALTPPNVDLVTEPIARIEPEGVLTNNAERP